MFIGAQIYLYILGPKYIYEMGRQEHKFSGAKQTYIYWGVNILVQIRAKYTHIEWGAKNIIFLGRYKHIFIRAQIYLHILGRKYIDMKWGAKKHKYWVIKYTRLGHQKLKNQQNWANLTHYLFLMP